MKKFVRRLAPIAAMALMPMAAVTIAMPALSSADPPNCDPGQWWDPTGNVCRPLGQGPAAAELRPRPVLGPDDECVPRVRTYGGRLISASWPGLGMAGSDRPDFSASLAARIVAGYAADVAAVEQSRRLVTEIPGPASLELTKRRTAAVSHGVGNTMPVFAARAAGGIVEDVDGNRFIDLGSGIAVTTIGNSAPRVVDAVGRRSPTSPTPASW